MSNQAGPPPRARTLFRLPIARAGQAMGLGTTLFILAAIAPDIATAWAKGSSQLRLGFALITGHQVVAATGLALVHRGQRDGDEVSPRARTALWLTAIPFVVGLGLTTGLRDQVQPSHIWSPAYWVVPWLSWALALLPLRRHWLVASGTVTTLTLIHLTGAAHRNPSRLAIPAGAADLAGRADRPDQRDAARPGRQLAAA